MNEYGNDTKLTVELTRHEICDMLRATTHIFIDFETEARDEALPADRRRIAESTAKYWRALHDKIDAQLDAWDAKHI